MSKTRIIYSTLAILFGVFMVVYGGYDDSPGGQLLGLAVIALGIMSVIRGRKKTD